ncbi:MAG: hypothetical protein LBE82_04265 [Chitinophagaceae bacterium]|jgi:hypothetical protein|nr:hypothetical protein [Chitinophagaceae bacterium]
MTVVNTKEFNANQEKYFDMAVNEQIFIQRDDCMFVVAKANEPEEEDIIFEPDEDFYKSITIDEVKERLFEHIHKLFANKNESISNG